MAVPHLLVHDARDSVGVVVVEGLKAGTDMTCVVTHDDTDFTLRSEHDIPIGHKVALRDMNAGDRVIKYGEDVGLTKAAVRKGEHVHTHNMKTGRW